MKEPRLEKCSNEKETDKRSEVKPTRPEQPNRRPKPTPNPPRKK